MRVRIHLLGDLARFSPTKQEKFELELPAGAIVSRVLEKIEFPTGLETVILVNGRHGNRFAALESGDEVALFMPEAGG